MKTLPHTQTYQQTEIPSSLLFSRRGPNCQVEIVREPTGRVRAHLSRGGVISQIPLRGFPSHLPASEVKKASQLLQGSYIVFHREVIEVRPRGCGGVQDSWWESFAEWADLPEEFICSITKGLMKEPIRVDCKGEHTFDRETVIRHIESKGPECPECRQAISRDSNKWEVNSNAKDEIQGWLEELGSLCPFPSTEVDYSVANARIRRGNTHREKKEYYAAIACYEEALECTDKLETYWEYVELLMEAKLPKKTRECIHLAKLYEEAEWVKEAREAYRKAVESMETDTLPEGVEYDKKLSEYYEKLIEEKPYLIEVRADGVNWKELQMSLKRKVADLWEEKSDKLKEEMLGKIADKRSHIEVQKVRIGKLQESVKKWETHTGEVKKHTVSLSLKGRSHEEMQAFWGELGEFPKLQDLSLSGFVELTAEDLGKVAEVKTLRKLNLSGCRKIGASVVGDLLRKNGEIESLVLRDNEGLTAEGFGKIFSYGLKLKGVDFKGCSQLEDKAVLKALLERVNDFSLRVILPSGEEVVWEANDRAALFRKKMDGLIEVIADEKERRVIREAVETLLRNDLGVAKMDLYLSGKGIGDSGAKALAVALEKNQTLQRLDLGGNQIGVEGAKALSVALEKNQTLQWLYFGGNQIGVEGAKALSVALEKNQMLQWLYLGGNQIGVEGAKALSVALEKNQTLQWLYFGGNQIGVEGAKALSVALEKNQTLQWLYFGGNQIGVEGAKALSVALEKNQTLQGLYLWGNQIGAEGAKALSVALEKNQTLQWLNLAVNQIGDSGVQALSVALEKNQTLQWLNLANNQIGVEGARALAVVLEKNQTLQWLSLEKNQIGAEGARALSVALEKNQTLQTLSLWSNQIRAEAKKAFEQAATHHPFCELKL